MKKPKTPTHSQIVSALDNYTVEALYDMRQLINRLIEREERLENEEEEDAA